MLAIYAYAINLSYQTVNNVGQLHKILKVFEQENIENSFKINHKSHETIVSYCKIKGLLTVQVLSLYC